MRLCEWDEMSLYERRNFLSGSEFGTDTHKGNKPRQYVCNMEIWAECFGREPAAMRKIDSYEIGAIMRRITEWEKYQSGGGFYVFPIYGRQRAYVSEQAEQD